MKLEKEDAELFYNLQHGLIWYANQSLSIIKNLAGKPPYEHLDPTATGELFEKIAYRPKIIEDFARENPLMYAEPERHIVRSWTKLVAGDFFAFSDTGHTIFLSGGKKQPEKAYAVYGLYDEISDIFPFEPIYVNIVLFPFKGKITYPGIFRSYQVSFGGSVRRSFMHSYMKAKSAFGIITSLEGDSSEKKSEREGSEELLRFYLKDDRNRAEYSEEINELLKKYPPLAALYLRELGKAHARKLRKSLSAAGTKDAWVAVYNDAILASGANEKEARARAEALLPEEKHSHLYVFHHKGKRI